MFNFLFFAVILSATFNANAMDLSALRQEFKNDVRATWQDWDKDAAFMQKVAANESFYNLVFIAPYRFKLLSSSAVPEIQEVVDKLVDKILSTSTGKEICQNSTGGEVDKIVSLFGVTDRMARKFSRSCQSADFKPYFKRQYLRDYVFILTEEDDISVSSWTNARNKTFIVLKPEDVTEVNLIKILSHEIAIKADLKEQWGVYGLNSMQKFLEVRYLGAKSLEVLTTIRDSKLKYSFAAIRAFKTENRILTELGFANEVFDISGGCEDQLLKVLPHVLNLSDLYVGEKNVITLLGLTPALPSTSFNPLEILLNENVFDKGQTINLCQYITTPEYSGATFSAFEGGPRPRVGNGKEIEEMSLSQKTILLQEMIKSPDKFNHIKKMDKRLKKEKGLEIEPKKK